MLRRRRRGRGDAHASTLPQHKHKHTNSNAPVGDARAVGRRLRELARLSASGDQHEERREERGASHDARSRKIDLDSVLCLVVCGGGLGVGVLCRSSRHGIAPGGLRLSSIKLSLVLCGVSNRACTT